MEDLVTLREAEAILGVDNGTLKRLVRTGKLPEAQKERGPAGPMWVVPTDVLADLAHRNGWTIDLTNDDVRFYPASEEPLSDSDSNAAPEPTVLESKPTFVTDEGLNDSDLNADELTETEIVTVDSNQDAPSVSEVLDTELLDRLLGAHEEKAQAVARSEETERHLVNLQSNFSETTEKLEVERREREIALERFRQEQAARYVADAKVSELRDRVHREMALAEAERQASRTASQRVAAAERDAANALSAMGWVGRKRYRKLARTQRSI